MKPKSKVFDHYVETTANDKTSYSCTFCKVVYKFKNATKFASHLTKCLKCPDNVKNSFQKTTAADITTNSTPQSPRECEPRPSTSTENPNERDEMNIHRAIARAVYVSGAPLSLLEHPLWKESFHLLNPSYNPPSRKMLSTSLLDEEYKEVQNTISDHLKHASVLHLAIDGWSNLRNESVLNVVLYGPKPFFYKFIETKNIRHTADYLSEEVSKILEEIGTQKFLAIISDNAANMVRCGVLLQEKYDNILWFGCLAHTLHLLIGDLLKITKVRNILAKILDITKTISKSHILNAEYRKVAEEKLIDVTLHSPVKTRWGSYLNCLQSFIKSKIILQTMVININTESLSRHKTHLLSESTWEEIEQLENIIKPIVVWITRLEGDYCTVHLVSQALKELEDLLNNSSTMDFLQNDRESLVLRFNNRKVNALKPIHFAAAILDPKNQGANLTPEENIDGCETIINMIRNERTQTVLEELSQYKCRTGIWGKNFVWKMAKTVEPMAWWESLFSKTGLGQIALNILSIPATSAAVERTFSSFSNIHRNKRNRLKTNRAGRISYISYNWKLLNRPVNHKTTSYSESSDSNSEDEFSDVILDDDMLIEPYVSDSDSQSNVQSEPEIVGMINDQSDIDDPLI